MSPIQNHGFKWENDIKENVFDINIKYKNTSIFDIYSKDNKYNKNENVSVKTSSSDSINCSDILRFYDYKDYEKITMIIIKYKQKDDYKILEKVIELDLNCTFHKFVFGNISRDELQKYCEYIKCCSNKDRDEYILLKTKLQQNYHMNGIINPKVDSKTQRRVQISFSLKKVLKELPGIIIYRSLKCRNKMIKTEIYSPKRNCQKNK
tara:strand:- start:4310 stop:4930 length:621 start_codon:yes stop_codon:yes gene_type:complete